MNFTWNGPISYLVLLAGRFYSDREARTKLLSGEWADQIQEESDPLDVSVIAISRRGEIPSSASRASTIGLERFYRQPCVRQLHLAHFGGDGGPG